MANEDKLRRFLFRANNFPEVDERATNGPAAQACIQPDEILTHSSDRRFDSSIPVKNAPFLHNPGDMVKIGLIWENQTLFVNIKLWNMRG